MESNSDSGEDNNKRIVDVEKQEGSPFNIVSIDNDEDKNSFIALGDNRITELMSYGKCKMLIAERNWELIVNCIAFMVDKMNGEVKEAVKRHAEDHVLHAEK